MRSVAYGHGQLLQRASERLSDLQQHQQQHDIVLFHSYDDDDDDNGRLRLTYAVR